MEDLSSIEVFVKAAELQSFTRAGQALGITSSGVGKSIARLEEGLGVRLLNRTTRRIGLTADGAIFFDRCRGILEDLAAARDVVSSRSVAPKGRLHVSLPTTIGRRIVMPELPRFLAVHPELEVDVSLSDRRINLVEDGVDVAVRIGLLGDSSLVARPIGQQQIVTLASPRYLEAGAIESIGDLPLHRCLAFRLPSTGRQRPWTFRTEGRDIEWRPRSRLSIDDGEALVTAACAALGVIQVPSYMAAEALASGELVEVLPQLRPHPIPIHAVFASRRNLPARVRAFVDFVTSLEGLRPTPLPRSKVARRTRRDRTR